MADYRAISNGNASDLARWEVWNGSAWVAATVLPTVMDVVWANGFTIDINFDLHVSQFRNGTTAGVVNGGSFNLLGGFIATGDRVSGDALNFSCMVHSADTDSWAIGNTYGAVGVSINSRNGTLCTGIGTLHSVGDAYAGSTGGALSSTATASCGIKSSGSGSFRLTGTAYSTFTTNGIGACNLGGGGIVDNAYGNDTQYAALGCEVTELRGRNLDCVVTGKFIMPTNMNPTWLNCFAKAGADVQIEIYDELGNAVICNPIAAQGQASPADVRLNTSYANGALTGTAAIPPAGAVSLGVPVDATVGTASVDASELRDLILPSILSTLTGIP